MIHGVRTVILKGHFSVSFWLIMGVFTAVFSASVSSDSGATVSNTADSRMREGYHSEVHETLELPLSS